MSLSSSTSGPASMTGDNSGNNNNNNNSNNGNNNGDNYNISIEFKNNCLGSYISNWFVPGGWTIKIYTQKKYFNFINLENCIMQDRSFKKTRINLTKADKNYKPGLKLMIESFYQYLKNDKKLEGFQSIEDNLNTMKLIDKLHAKQ